MYVCICMYMYIYIHTYIHAKNAFYPIQSLKNNKKSIKNQNLYIP